MGDKSPRFREMLGQSRVQTWFMVEYRDIIVTQKISPQLLACKHCHPHIVIYFDGINLTFHFGYGWNDPTELCTLAIDVFCMRQYWYKSFKSGRWKYSHAIRAEQMNLKLSINLSLHADSTGDAPHAGSTSDTRVYSGWRDFGQKPLRIQ